MLLRIKGQIRDGSKQSDGTYAPAPGVQPLNDEDGPGSIPAGADVIVECAITKQDATALDMTARTSVLKVRQNASSGQVLASIPGVNQSPASAGIVHYAVPADITRPLTGQYVYDIFVSNGSARDEVVPNSLFEVRPAVGA